ncbi:hypothetical protein AQ490_17295 [Wenjunlia vitaminophila]|uniref:Uncharacterized protein n=1 Tax=Wenjunlia vitaminophila TaxID=76728 RepID=A0A0T6LWR2_WENVI|nr:hypothetical protein [Wenjunlia vitaminophila]KRV50156.1 hypothetical protein AQ490_17295 [Wenjunlia vitaminophila]
MPLVPALLSPVTIQAVAEPLGKPELPAYRADKVVPLSPEADREIAELVRRTGRPTRSRRSGPAGTSSQQV